MSEREEKERPKIMSSSSFSLWPFFLFLFASFIRLRSSVYILDISLVVDDRKSFACESVSLFWSGFFDETQGRTTK